MDTPCRRRRVCASRSHSSQHAEASAMATEARSVTQMRDDDGPPFDFRLHRNALLELAAFLGAAAIIQLMLLEPGTLASVKPHPFWIAVVLISLQYGTIDG